MTLDAEIDPAGDQRHQLVEVRLAGGDPRHQAAAGRAQEAAAGLGDPPGDARAVHAVEAGDLIEREAVEVVVTQEVALLGRQVAFQPDRSRDSVLLTVAVTVTISPS